MEKDVKEQQIKTVINSAQFRFMKDSMSFLEMSRLTEKPLPEILKKWKSFGDGLKNDNIAKKYEPQAPAQQAPQNAL